MADKDLSELGSSIKDLTSEVRELSNNVANSRALDPSSIQELAEAIAKAVSGTNNVADKAKTATESFESLGEEIRALESKLGSLADVDIGSKVKSLQEEINKMTEGLKRSQDKVADLSSRANLRPNERQSLADTQAGLARREAEIQSKLSELQKLQELEPIQAQLADARRRHADMASAQLEAEEALGKEILMERIAAKKRELAEEKARVAEVIANMRKLATSSIPDLIISGLSGANEITKAKMQIVAASFGKVFDEFMKVLNEGIRKATTLGVSAAEGVGVEFGNRFRALISAFSFDASKMVTPEQIFSAQKAFVDASVGVREGRVISTEGSAEFAKTLKTGFKSEFELTSESLRGLAVAGLTSAQDFESFRQASGRASLSSGQFAQIVNRNALSFLLFGNSVAKAAADADRLGISFSSIQKGQESFVTNLDGGIDTIAQLNQLGAGLDFGTLVQLSEFGTPDQIMNYIKTAVPQDLMKGASVRALFGQLFPGLDAEALLRMNQVGGTLDTIEGAMTKAGTPETTGVGASIAQFGNIVKSTFGPLLTAITGVGIAIFAVMKTSSANTVATLANTLAVQQNTAAKLGLPVMSPLGVGAPAAGGLGSLLSLKTGLGVLGGTAIGTGLGMAGGASGKAAGTASAIGSILGAVIGAFTPVGPVVGSMIGGALFGGIAGLANDADISIPSGYGPYGLTDFSTRQTMAFNSGDRLLAMRKPEGSVSTGQSNEKLDKLISTLNSKTVPIKFEGAVVATPRLAEMVGGIDVGVKFRNDGPRGVTVATV